jgi:hypothetical protein
MTKAAIEKQIKAINDSFKKDLNYLDLNYKVVEPEEKGRGITLGGGDVIINQLKIWLQSGRYDYIRKPDYAGFFDNQLNDRYPFSPDSEEAIKGDLVSTVETMFPQIEVLACDVNCDFNARKWKVRLAVKDRITGVIGAIKYPILCGAGNV